MGKRPSDRPDPGVAPPGATDGTAALASALQVMLPLAQLLLRQGVPYGAFAEALKPVFLDAARRELQRDGVAVTQSSLSVLSGVHRKDVRTLTAAPDASPAAAMPLASQIFTRWIGDAAFRVKGKPRRLPRSGPAPSFDALARSVSTDVHPRTVLDELLRLGVVRLETDGEEEVVVPVAEGFIPAEGMAEMLAVFSANASDHLAAAVHNLSGSADRFLEQSVFANGMTPESAQLLAGIARQAWAQAFQTMVDAANERVAHDQQIEGNHRIRFGAYFYSEPPQPSAAPAPAAAPKTRRKSPKGKS